jgi:hypothetical protein
LIEDPPDRIGENDAGNHQERELEVRKQGFAPRDHEKRGHRDQDGAAHENVGRNHTGCIQV